MHIMNKYNALYPLITLYNALYIKASSKVLPEIIYNFFFYVVATGSLV